MVVNELAALVNNAAVEGNIGASLRQPDYLRNEVGVQVRICFRFHRQHNLAKALPPYRTSTPCSITCMHVLSFYSLATQSAKNVNGRGDKEGNRQSIH